MRSLNNASPLTVFIYFAAVTGVAMFCRDPITASISLFFSVAFYFVRGGRGSVSSHVRIAVLFVVLSLINPFFYHNGATVLFFIGDSPITLEATLYGITSSTTVVAVIYWFRSFSEIMTEDKLLSLFGTLSPKFSLMVSMILRFVPMFARRSKQVNDAQRVLGMYKNDNVVDSVRGGAKVFSGVTGWALEGGIVTADSMEARGYGSGRRTLFSLYRFGASDALFVAITTLMSGVLIAGFFISGSFVFYPEMIVPSGVFAVISYVLYGAVCAQSIVFQIAEELKWKRLKSKI